MITVRNTVELRILSSVATLEVHKSLGGVKTDCSFYQKNTSEVNFESF